VSNVTSIGEYHQVEEILDRRVNPDGELEYQIKWMAQLPGIGEILGARERH
jgi:hypothetical protein